MARPCKQGLDYFPLDTDLFLRDGRIRLLISRFGAGAVCVYLYILCRCYGDGGYYALASTEFWDMAGCDLHMKEPRLREIVDFLAEKQLLDAALLGEGVLTSSGIQRRFQEAVRGSAARRRRGVRRVDAYWLLPSAETEDYILPESDPSEPDPTGVSTVETPSECPSDEGFDEFSPSKPDKEKEKKIKPNQTKLDAAASKPATVGRADLSSTQMYGSFENVYLSAEEVAQLKERLPDWEQWVERLSLYMASRGRHYRSHYATLLSWAQSNFEPQIAAPPWRAPGGKAPQPPAGDFTQPVALEPGELERRALARLHQREEAAMEA